MIQTQTFAFDDETKAELLRISALIAKHRNDPAKFASLITEHDEIVKRAPTKFYDPRDDA